MRSHCPSPEHLDISGVGNEGGGGAVTPAAQETPRTLNTGHQLSQAIVSPFTQIAHSQRYYYYKQSLFAGLSAGTKTGVTRYCAARQSGDTQYEMKYRADNDWDI